MFDWFVLAFDYLFVYMFVYAHRLLFTRWRLESSCSLNNRQTSKDPIPCLPAPALVSPSRTYVVDPKHAVTSEGTVVSDVSVMLDEPSRAEHSLLPVTLEFESGSYLESELR